MASKAGKDLQKKACPHCETRGKPWYITRMFLVIWILLGALGVHMVIASQGIFFMGPFWFGFADYLSLIWWAILLGFLVGGIIDRFVPGTYVRKYLSTHKKRSILYAVGFGFLASACSHGILAIAIELYRKGASTPSVIAFLLASPWANLPITILLFGFFGVNALYIILSAILVAVVTGLIFQVLDRRCLIECKVKGSHGREKEDPLKGFSIRKDVARRWKGYKCSREQVRKDAVGVLRGSWSLAGMVLWWLLIGMVMASIARGYVPEHLFMTYMGPSLLGLGITLVFATIIEVCSEGSSPLAFEIFRQTGAFGNSFTFLMAGVSTDYTEIGLVASNIGRRTALLIPLITVPQILVLGFLFNVLL